MRLARPRLTLRVLVGLVAVASLFLAYASRVDMARRRVAYLQIAARHARQRSLISESINARTGRVDFWVRYDPATTTWFVSSQAESRYHARLEETYRAAAEHPWRPVAPDPPAPGRPR